MRKLHSFFVWGALLLCAGTILWIPSCRKADAPSSLLHQSPEEKFFTVPDNVPGTVKRIAALIKEQNARYGFINRIIAKEGYVFWDQADMQTGKLPGRVTIDTLVMLPMVLENQRQVNSLLACKVSGDKIEIFLHRGRRYSFYKFDDDPHQLTANGLTMELMYLQKKIFGDSIFRVNDSRLFAQPGKPNDKSKIIAIRSSPPPFTSLHTWISFAVERCYWYGDDGDQGQVVGVAPGGSNNYADGEWICYTAMVHVFINDYNGGGGSGPVIDPGGGGGGGGGPVNPTPYGWWSHEPCEVPDPNGPQEPVDDLDPNPEPCTDGIREVWHPLYPMLDIENIFTDFTNPCIIAAKNKLPDNMLKIFAKELLIQSEQHEPWTFSFSEDPTVVDDQGLKTFGASSPDTVNKIWNIRLNPHFWTKDSVPNPNQEIAGYAILHEMVHGFLFIYKKKYGLDVINNFNTHRVMFTNFITVMSKTLQNAYGISAADATALSLQGLDDALKRYASGAVVVYQSFYNQFCIDHYGMSLQDARGIYQQYMDGPDKGTKCF